jgi:hypothetical protein
MIIKLNGKGNTKKLSSMRASSRLNGKSGRVKLNIAQPPPATGKIFDFTFDFTFE